MKKLFPLFILTLVVNSVAAAMYDCEIGGIYYKIEKASRTAYVTKDGWQNPAQSYIGLTSITIPSTITYDKKPYSVVGIGASAFERCENLYSVTLPESIKWIGERAFGGCTGIVSIVIPKTVKEVAPGAFDMVNNVEYYGTVEVFQGHAKCINGYVDGNLVYSDSSKKRLCGCSSTAKGEITIPNSVTEIKTNAFYNCRNLSNIIIPNSVQKIGSSAFAWCSSLGSIVLPNSITTIESHVLMRCDKLTSISLPSSIIEIKERAFEDCYKLKFMVIPSSVKKCDDFIFADCTLTDLIYLSENITNKGYINTFSGCKIKNLYCAQSIDLTNVQNIEHVYRLNASELGNPFPIFAKSYVESRMNQWQKKGEYEKTADWQQRVTEESRRKKANEFLKEAKDKYLPFYKSQQNYNFTLGKYDSENEVYLIQESNLGDLLVPVPIKEAENVRKYWKYCKYIPYYDIVGNSIGVSAVYFSFPDNKMYSYKMENNLSYTQTNIQYNFDPINIIDQKSSTPQKGQQTIKYEQLSTGKSSVDKNIPQTNKSCPSTFAFIISNEDYTYLSDVPYATNDGSIFAEYCKNTLGIPKDNIKQFTNATYAMMINAVRRIKDIASAYNGNVNVIVYYSGHGAPSDNTKEAYLLPVDAYGVNPDVCYSLDKLYQELGNANIRAITVFLDACFSGASRDGAMLASAKSVAITAKKGTPVGNMVVMSAAQGDETAGFYEEQGHGLFTYYLLKKLQETKGDVTLEELSNYVTTEVRRRSVVQDKIQTPCVTPASAVVNVWKNWKL